MKPDRESSDIVAARATPRWLPELSRDGWILFATGGIRGFATGFFAVVFGLYLAVRGLDAATIGLIFTAALAGGAVATVLATTLADRLGRRRILIVSTTVMALTTAVVAVTNSVVVLAIAGMVGAVSPSGNDVGALLPIEQAILPQAARAEQRTHVFAFYNLVSSFAGAIGALSIGLPATVGMTPIAGDRALIATYAILSLALLLLYTRLSPRVEPARTPSGTAPARHWLGVHRSRGALAKLVPLFALDSFGGALVVQALIAYWFYVRYGVDTRTLGAIFFGTSLLAALSFLAAAPVAKRVGLLNTMVFTHLPSNVLLMLVPLMPNLALSAAALLARSLLSQMDVPTRQSYTMAIVDPDERSAVAGITSVARKAGGAVAPSISGVLLSASALAVPFLIGGAVKIVYDLAMFAVFCQVHPPEEISRAPDSDQPESLEQGLPRGTPGRG